jgi:lysophospholipase L1-like esterase
MFKKGANLDVAARAGKRSTRMKSAHLSRSRRAARWATSLGLVLTAVACGDDTKPLAAGPTSTAVENSTPGVAGSGESGAPPAAPAGGAPVASGEGAVGGSVPLAQPPADSGGSAPIGAPAAGADGGTLPVTPLPALTRLIAVGDSTTQSTCWRALLWQVLDRDFPGRTDFVGSHTSDDGCPVPGYDMDNEAYGSSLVTEIAAGITTQRTCNPACPSLDDLRQRFTAAQPDVALMHFGTNDVWNNIPPGDVSAPGPGSILAAYDAVLQALRGANPNIVVFVAQIIPMNPTTATCDTCACPECGGRVVALDQEIVPWAARVSTPASPVLVVDQWTGFDVAADTKEGVHPNLAGSQKMADRWYAALAPLLL